MSGKHNVTDEGDHATKPPAWLMSPPAQKKRCAED